MDRPSFEVHIGSKLIVATALAAALSVAGAPAAPQAKRAAAPAPAASAPAVPQPTEIAPPMRLSTGKSTLLRLAEPTTRISVGAPDIADVVLINPNEIYLLGKKAGSTNVFLWSKGGRTTIMDVIVNLDTTGLQDKLAQLMPEEKGITVSGAGDSLVLSGKVADATRVHRAVSLAEQFGGKKVVNFLSTTDPMQVMLEVKVAEVAKTVIDKLGAQVNWTGTSGRTSFSLLMQFLTGAAGAVNVTRSGSTNALSLDAELRNGMVKILAEPTIMAISGQEGSFLSGGKVFIPVAQGGMGVGGIAYTLEEKEFGVGLKFTPTVLEGGRINLRVTPEVSELSQVGAAFTANTGLNTLTSVLPEITTRRASTTVQLMDGQTFAIGGLIQNNVTEAMKKFPGLGELPVLGALFRSTEFQNDRTELLFIITPRLVKPLVGPVALPTDRFVPPTPAELMLGGQSEGAVPPAPATSAPAAPPAKQPVGSSGGYELK